MNIKVDSDYIRSRISLQQMSLTNISRFILGRSKGHLSDRLRIGDLNQEDIDKLYEYLVSAGVQISKKKMLIAEEPKKPETTPEATSEALVLVLNNLYNILNEIKAETKSTNALLRRIEAKPTGGISKDVLNNLNSNVNAIKESTKQIFTDIHYKTKF